MGFAKISYLSVEDVAMNNLKLWREQMILELEEISIGQEKEAWQPVDLCLYGGEIYTGIVVLVNPDTGGIKMRCMEDGLVYTADFHISQVDVIINPSVEFPRENSDEFDDRFDD